MRRSIWWSLLLLSIFFCAEVRGYREAFRDAGSRVQNNGRTNARASNQVTDGPPFAALKSKRKPFLCSACRLLMEEMQEEVARKLAAKDFSLLATSQKEIEMQREVVKVALADVCSQRFRAWARKEKDFHFSLPHYHRCANTGSHACMNVETPFQAGSGVDAERSYICKYYVENHGEFFIEFFTNFPLEYEALPEYDLGEHFCYDHVSVCTPDLDPTLQERRERDPYEHVKFGSQGFDGDDVNTAKQRQVPIKSAMQENREKMNAMREKAKRLRKEEERKYKDLSRIDRMKERYARKQAEAQSTGFANGKFTPGQFVGQSGHANYPKTEL